MIRYSLGYTYFHTNPNWLYGGKLTIQNFLFLKKKKFVTWKNLINYTKKDISVYNQYPKYFSNNFCIVGQVGEIGY